MRARRWLKWLFRPVGSSIVLSGVLALAACISAANGIGVFDEGFSFAPGGVVLLVVVFLAGYLAVAHLTVLLRALGAYLWRSTFWLELSALVTASVVALVWAHFVTPDTSSSDPPSPAAGGLTVFATFPIDDLHMTVRRATVGLGSDAREVLVDLTFRAPTNQDQELSIVGSGAASFDTAGVFYGAEGQTGSTGNLADLSPDEPTLNVKALPVVDAQDLLPSTASGAIAVARNSVSALTLDAPWFEPSTTKGSSISVRVVSPSEASHEITLSWALRLAHQSVGSSTGGLGNVGCASNLDSVARVQNGGKLPNDLIKLAVPDDSKSWSWQIPAKCEVKVVIGQIHDHPVYLNGDRKSGAGITTVEFTGVSTRQDAPAAGIDGLTVPATSYWVPDLASQGGNPILSTVLLGLAVTGLCSAILLVWRKIRGRRETKGNGAG